MTNHNRKSRAIRLSGQHQDTTIESLLFRQRALVVQRAEIDREIEAIEETIEKINGGGDHAA